MKRSLHSSKIKTAAAALSCGWFAFWMLFFQPADQRPPIQMPDPYAALLQPDQNPFTELNDPTLFALSNRKGFSGDFIPAQINQKLSLEKPVNPAVFRTARKPQPFRVEPGELYQRSELPQTTLPVPGIRRQNAKNPLSGQFFFSPELSGRISGTIRIDLSGPELPQIVRAKLQVSADGQVERIFFDTPVNNARLLRRLYEINFTPADRPVIGTVSIQFNPNKSG